MRRKLIFLLTIAALLVGILPVGVSAAQTSDTDLLALARYFPNTTAAFVTVRSDDEFIDTLDALLDSLRENLPPGTLPPITIRRALDQIAGQVGGSGSTFDDAMRPWLGDSFAVGVPTLDAGNPQTIVAISVADNAAASAFVQSFLDLIPMEYTTVNEANYSLYSPTDVTLQSRSQSFLLAEDVALIGNDPDALVAMFRQDGTLASSASFTEAIAMLPADSYSAIGFIDIPQALPTAEELIQNRLDGMEAFATPLDPTALLSAFGPAAFGFTVMGDRSLVLDYAQTLGDTSALQDMGLVPETFIVQPIDLSFAENLPGDVPLVVQASALGPSVSTYFDALIQWGRMLQEQGFIDRAIDQSRDLGDTSYVPRFVSDMNPGRALVVGINFFFSGLTGLNLERDVLNWMTDDYAFFVRVDVNEDDETAAPLIDAGFVVAATDADAAAVTVAGLSDSLTAYEVPFSTEEIGGGDVLVLSLAEMFPDDSALSELPDDYDILIGSNDAVFAIGTRRAVSEALEPGDSLAENAAFIEATEYLLPDAQSMWYISFATFAEPFGIYAQQQSGSSGDQAQRAEAIFRAANSATLSHTNTPEGDTTIRFVLTLAE
ncbi:MAG: DUF3352 domain-containing protein [Burkholderiales bacterium]|nr:DUF3352 domain-containing protein [Anaerolineae bacterium]